MSLYLYEFEVRFKPGSPYHPGGGVAHALVKTEEGMKEILPTVRENLESDELTVGALKAATAGKWATFSTLPWVQEGKADFARDGLLFSITPII